MVPFQNFATADGWIVVACPKETLWRRLCAVLERESLAEDPRFSSFAARSENRDALLVILAPLFRAGGTAAWLERLTAADVPCGEIQDVAGALDDPQARAREAVVDWTIPSSAAFARLPARFG